MLQRARKIKCVRPWTAGFPDQTALARGVEFRDTMRIALSFTCASFRDCPVGERYCASED